MAVAQIFVLDKCLKLNKSEGCSIFSAGFISEPSHHRIRPLHDLLIFSRYVCTIIDIDATLIIGTEHIAAEGCIFYLSLSSSQSNEGFKKVLPDDFETVTDHVKSFTFYELAYQHIPFFFLSLDIIGDIQSRRISCWREFLLLFENSVCRQLSLAFGRSPFVLDDSFFWEWESFRTADMSSGLPYVRVSRDRGSIQMYKSIGIFDFRIGILHIELALRDVRDYDHLSSEDIRLYRFQTVYQMWRYLLSDRCNILVLSYT